MNNSNEWPFILVQSSDRTAKYLRFVAVDADRTGVPINRCDDLLALSYLSSSQYTCQSLTLTMRMILNYSSSLDKTTNNQNKHKIRQKFTVLS